MNEERDYTLADLGNEIRKLLIDTAEAVHLFLAECGRAIRKLHEAIYEVVDHIEESREKSNTPGYVKLMQAYTSRRGIRPNTKPHHLKARYRRRTP